MKELNFKETLSWSSVSRMIISILALSYLAFIPVKGLDKSHRLETTEVGLITIILLINSKILDRLQEFKFGSNGVDFKLADSKIKANTEANQKESKALTLLGTLTIPDNENRRKFFDILLNDGELKIIEKLFLAGKDNGQFLYEKNEENEQKLRHLVVIGFLENLTETPITLIPDGKNLRDYFKLSCAGKICLALGSSNIYSEDVVNECVGDTHCHALLTTIVHKNGFSAENPTQMFASTASKSQQLQN
ncbi:MAG: hypothetical protein KME60_00540 [Cyanomargarita calcarea GSE-NOS-MK-12-04C]|jgi:hypothetical protein|uniref:Uncharacterized protein n=1 Tax=Cyanomargarita calcarea GSE-NOS-MK-12-04C TaxID=2839659 RepID=A0A951QGL7_9CYAN|nr:hypothetical protein [Cyanomargarita calcarea GSE-NOS-MK-12-04C]